MGDYQKLELISNSKEYGFDKSETFNKLKDYRDLKSGKEYSSINCIKLFPKAINLCAIAAGTKIIFCDLENKEISKTFGGFKNIVRCVDPRKDGRLYVSSDDDGFIKVIDTNTSMVLRQFSEHSGPVYSCKFSPSKVNILSGGDDSTLKYYDISVGRCVNTYTEHKDFIRTVEFSSMENIFISGSYDNTIKLWDIRMDNNKASFMTLQHDSPVECVKVFKNGLMIASVGGNEAKIWDISRQGKLFSSMRNHIQTVTSVVIPQNDFSEIITCSLDKTIKWSCMNTGKSLYALKCKSMVMTIDGLDDEYLAGGLTDGSWFIKVRKNHEKSSNTSLSAKVYNPNSLKYFKRGRNELPSENAIIVNDFQNRRHKKVDQLLRSFRYQAAYDYAVESLPATSILSVIQELIQRGGLEIASREKDENSMKRILKFFMNQIGKPSSYNLCLVLEALNILIEENSWIYNCQDKSILKMLQVISQKVGFEIKGACLIMQIQGLLDSVERIMNE